MCIRDRYHWKPCRQDNRNNYCNHCNQFLLFIFHCPFSFAAVQQPIKFPVSQQTYYVSAQGGGSIARYFVSMGMSKESAAYIQDLSLIHILVSTWIWDLCSRLLRKQLAKR